MIRDNGDIYVATTSNSGNAIYRYPGGSVSLRTKFVSFPNDFDNAALQFSLDKRSLYLTSSTSGNLNVVDPDTAVATEVIPPGGLYGSLSIAVFGTLIRPSWTNYDYGFPGTNGTPSLPDDPKLTGLIIDAQAIEVDPGASMGISFTAGLEFVLAY